MIRPGGRTRSGTRPSVRIQFLFLFLVKDISNAHFVKDIYLYENIFYILIQFKWGPSFCFPYTFSIKYGFTCPFSPFTTFIHYDIISRFQYQNIYKKKIYQSLCKKCQICFMNAWLELYFTMIKQRSKHFHA